MNPENSANQPEPEGSPAAAGAAAGGGLPLRGVAMLLIAVAVLLGLWGLYTLTQGGDNGSTAASGTSEATATAGSEPGTTGHGDPSPAPAEERGPDTEEDRAEERPESPDEEEDSAARPAADGERDDPTSDRTEGTDDEHGAGAGAADRGEGDPAATKRGPVVNVLNNSTVDGLAEDIYGRLEYRGADMGEHGNLPGDVVTLPETTVYYHPGDAAGEQIARDLGALIGNTNGVPVRIEIEDDSLPEETTGPGNVTLVLIGEVVL